MTGNRTGNFASGLRWSRLWEHGHAIARFWFCIEVAILLSPLSLLIGRNMLMAETPVVPLELERAVPIEGIREPSGLTWHRGKLYSVSDKIDDAVFVLTFGQDMVKATAEPLHWREPPQSFLDLEGITSDGERLYLLSEQLRCVFRPDDDGQMVTVVRLAEFNVEGLFTKPGTGPEGISLLADGTLVVAIEREPSGIMELRQGGSRKLFDDDGDYPQRLPRPKDVTGLCVVGDELWCLTRNGEAIARMCRTVAGWRIVGRLTFGHETDALTYSDDRYGTAEGIAVGMDRVFIVLDNNGLTRKGTDADIRPMLLVFHLPAALRTTP